MAEKKTLEEHREYLKEMIRLSLWFAADWKNKNPKEDFIHIIEERTNLVNMTDFNPAALFDYPTYKKEGGWPEVREKLCKINEETPEPWDFEERAYCFIEPFTGKRAEMDLEDLNSGNMFFQYENSCFRYDVTQKGEYLEFHIANSLYPNSFLADKKFFFSRMKDMILDAEKYGFKGITTNTWLNELPAWQKMFPQEWRESVTDIKRDIDWALGYWGQFLTARQTYNSRLGEKLRSTGIFPYALCRCRVDITIMKTFIERQENEIQSSGSSALSGTESASGTLSTSPD